MSLNTITLQYSGVRGQQKNTSYPFRKEISTPEELAEIAEFDGDGNLIQESEENSHD